VVGWVTVGGVNRGGGGGDGRVAGGGGGCAATGGGGVSGGSGVMGCRTCIGRVEDSEDVGWG